MAVLKSAANGVPAHPGIALGSEVENRGISQSELARQSGITFQRINGMIRGRRGITPDSALRLEQALGVSAQDMLTAQAEYDLYKTRLKTAKLLKRIQPFVAGKQVAGAT